ncbi:MAG: YkgJ family cysteine cluster protein [Candidatus Thermoplasmatota archaeon]|nr:YkgJ family cysteine cluster protein [Candidatus Thermoplasmatota archaeon]MBU1941028.1 YkgJ family cysteine cluster protein [Candidatus Thermoplasmatota archaeon]
MHLTFADITQILRQGYDSSFFIKKNNGWMQLKNKKGRCVFHTGNSCSIYPNRPRGCRLYPIVYDIEHQTAMYDTECPYPLEFLLDPKQSTEIKQLIAVLFEERAFRQASKHLQDTKTGQI